MDRRMNNTDQLYFSNFIYLSRSRTTYSSYKHTVKTQHTAAKKQTNHLNI